LNYFNYFTEIEETFIRRRGRNLLLSPLDWALIETWQERQIPLHVVLNGIEKVFNTVDKQPARKRTVKSLMYCREEIEAQHAEWLESQIGKNGGGEVETNENAAEKSLFSRQAIANHLKQVSSDLENARKNAKGNLRETLARVLSRLAKLENKFENAEKLEESLEKLDALIDDTLLQTLATEDLKNETKKQLAAYQKKMEADIYRRTFDLMLLKRLREQTEIPRLSLFYL
jgi:DNA repair exonuclease SbcCD ATPase subunit